MFILFLEVSVEMSLPQGSLSDLPHQIALVAPWMISKNNVTIVKLRKPLRQDWLMFSRWFQSQLQGVVTVFFTDASQH